MIAMATLFITIESRKNIRTRILATLKDVETGKPVTPRHVYAFHSYDRLHRTLTPSRMNLIAVLAGQGTMTAETVAGRLGHAVEDVDADLTALALCGVIDRVEDGFVFPYSRVQIEAKLW